MSGVRVVLASASPRRAELLRAAGLTFETLAVDVDEAVRPGEASKEYVRRLASEKSARAQKLLQGSEAIVIGADTAGVIDGENLRQPAADCDEGLMPRRPSGRCHDVLPGLRVP